MKPAFIVDANVLIDLLNSDRQVLKLVSSYLGGVFVSHDLIRDEIHELTDEECEQLGITLVDAEVEQRMRAQAPIGPLSEYDRLCLVLAQDNGWSCVTNDGELRKACALVEVETVWGLELLLRLVDANGMTVDDAITTADLIQKANPRYITARIIADFRRKVRRAK